MLFHESSPAQPGRVLAISQPAHALLSGQILAAWTEPVDERVVLAAAQHDIAWLDWEVMPEFDPATGRPREFRTVGAAEHAPMWERGVERALAAWGRRAALMISRHGSTIYRRFSDRHRRGDADERAAHDYLARHAALQRAWAGSLGLDAAAVERDADLIAFVDTLSLMLCGALPAAPIPVGSRTVAVVPVPDRAGTFRLDPWPLRPGALALSVEARALPPEGRLADEAAMREWLSEPASVAAKLQLVA